jgi:hypothetical protein
MIIVKLKASKQKGNNKMSEFALRGYTRTKLSRYYVAPTVLEPCKIVKPKDEKLCEQNKQILEDSRRTAAQRKKYPWMF